MSDSIKNIPKNIYLQVDSDGDDSEIEFKDLAGVSWCDERVYKSDLKFQLNQTDSSLFTKEDMIAFANYVPEYGDAKLKKAHLEDYFKTWMLDRK